MCRPIFVIILVINKSHSGCVVIRFCYRWYDYRTSGVHSVLLPLLTRGNNFPRISCTVFESNKNGSLMVVFVTLFATNFIEVQQCKERSKFLLHFFGGSLFSRDLIRSHANFIPHGYFKNVFFFKHCILNQLIIL